MWRPGKLQNPPKMLFALFYRFSRNSAKMMEFLVIYKKSIVFVDFWVFGGPSCSDHAFEQGIHVFREGSRNPGNH